MTITRWEDRLNAMDTSKGVSNKMIQTAMRDEIRELRNALRLAERRLIVTRVLRDKWKRAATRSRLDLRLSERRLVEARSLRDEWKTAAMRYQQELGKLRGA